MKQKIFAVFSICLALTFSNGYFKNGDGGSPKLSSMMIEGSIFEKNGEGGSPKLVMSSIFEGNGEGGPRLNGGGGPKLSRLTVEGSMFEKDSPRLTGMTIWVPETKVSRFKMEISRWSAVGEGGNPKLV